MLFYRCLPSSYSFFFTGLMPINLSTIFKTKAFFRIEPTVLATKFIGEKDSLMLSLLRLRPNFTSSRSICDFNLRYFKSLSISSKVVYRFIKFRLDFFLFESPLLPKFPHNPLFHFVRLLSDQHHLHHKASPRIYRAICAQ